MNKHIQHQIRGIIAIPCSSKAPDVSNVKDLTHQDIDVRLPACCVLAAEIEGRLELLEVVEVPRHVGAKHHRNHHAPHLHNL